MFYVKAIDQLNRVIRWTLAALLLGMTLCTLWQVAVRFLLGALNLNVAAPWTEELARYMMIWVIFLGAAVACRKAQLISLDIVVQRSSKKVGGFIRYVSFLVCLIFFIVMIALGMQFMEFGAIEFSPVLSMPKTWVYAALPIGFSLMILNTVALIIESHCQRLDIRYAGQNLGQE